MSDADRRSPLAPGPRPHILWADADADIPADVHRLLTDRYDVEVVPDGEAALASARLRPPDLVLAGVVLPRLDGLGLLHALRADPRTRTIPLILLSARDGEEADAEGLEAGADDYLTRPFSARELLARVGVHLERARIRREAQGWVTHIFDSVMDGLVTCDREYCYTYVNAQAEGMLGRPRGELLGKCLWDEFPAVVGTEIDRQLRRAVAEQVTCDFEGHNTAWDRWYENRAFPMPDGGAAVHFRDVTDRKRAEVELRKSEERFRRYFELGLIGMAITSSTKGCLAVNDEICRILGYERDELLHMTWAEMTYPDDLAADVAQFNRVLAGEIDGYTMDKRWVRKDGRVIDTTISVRCVLKEHGAADFFVALLQDVTDRKRAEEALRRAHAEMETRVRERTTELARADETLQAQVGERRQAEEARTELLRRLTTAQEDERRRISRELHDQVGQHLTFLTLGLKALRDIGLGPAPDQGLLERLQKTAEELGREVHDLALRLRPTALDDLGLRAALQSAVEEWSRRAGVEADFHSSGLEGRRLPDEAETTLYRVVLEALHNILRHARARHVSVLLERRDHNAVAIVEDDGVGFDAEAMLTPPPGRLGLLSMRERLALVGGTLEVESTPGAGATVFARIPLPPEKEGSQP